MILLKFISKPKITGAVLPSSRFLVKRIANYVPKDATVLELGAGTGVITLEMIKRGLTSDRLFICEYDPDLCHILKKKFPGYSVFCKDASVAHTFLKPNSVDCVISGLPLRNFSAQFREHLIDSLRKVVKPGGFLLQYTYGFNSPLRNQLWGERQEYVMANIPPAFIWKYHFDLKI